MKDVTFILGEDKCVSFLVISTKNEPFNIRGATWELYRDKTLESSGECVIDGHEIHVQLSPQRKSAYYFLVVTYRVANELLKKRVTMEVV